MNDVQGEKIGAGELTAMIIIALVMKASDTTPTLLFKEGENAGWILPLISGLFIFIPLIAVLSLLKMYKNKGLIDIIYSLTGRYIGFFTGMFLLIIFIENLVTNSRSYVDIMSTLFFPKTPIIALYLVLIASAYVIANLGLYAISRSSWVFIAWLQAAVLILVLASMEQINIGYMFPIAGPGFMKLLKEGIAGSTYLTDILYLAVIFPFVRGYKEYRKASLIGYGIVIFEFIAVMFLLVTVFDYPTILYMNYPIQQLTSLVRFGSYFENVEPFFLGFWVIGAILRFSLYLYLNAAAFADILKLKTPRPLLIPFAALTLLLGMIPRNFYENVIITRYFTIRGTWWFLFAFPLVLWMIARLRRDMPNEKS